MVLIGASDYVIVVALFRLFSINTATIQWFIFDRLLVQTATRGQCRWRTAVIVVLLMTRMLTAAGHTTVRWIRGCYCNVAITIWICVKVMCRTIVIGGCRWIGCCARWATRKVVIGRKMRSFHLYSYPELFKAYHTFSIISYISLSLSFSLSHTICLDRLLLFFFLLSNKWLSSSHWLNLENFHWFFFFLNFFFFLCVCMSPKK